MQPTEFIWLNGKFVKWNDANVHVLSHTLHYGSGAFEGIKCYKTSKGAAIFRLKDHAKRMVNSFSIFGVKSPYSAEDIENAVKETVKINKLEEGYIRPIIFFGYGEMGLKSLDKCEINFAVACWQWGAYLGNKAINVGISEIKRISEKSFRTDAKICAHYVNSILASISAKKNGYDEAIMLDYENNVAEGPGENIFIIKDKVIYTPKLGSILPGITRNTIMALANDFGYKVIEKSISVKELFDADECFFTGTAAEVTAIQRIDGKVIGKSNNSGITDKLKAAYFDLVHGKNKKYESWMDYIK